jgi:hypothetical protein
VPAIRTLLAQRRLAVLLCVATLLLKVVVPTGYMIDEERGRIAITICSGTGPVTMAMNMPAAHGAMPGHGKADNQGKAGDHGKAEMPCAFASLSFPGLDAIDPIQLAVFMAFIMAVGFAGFLPLPALRRAHLRPPLRGPPASG